VRKYKVEIGQITYSPPFLPTEEEKEKQKKLLGIKISWRF